MPMKKTIQITVTASLDLPNATDLGALEGKTVDLTLTGAVIEGIAMDVGDTVTHRRGRRGRSIKTPDTLDVLVVASGATFTERTP